MLLAGAFAFRAARWRPLELTGPEPADGFTRVSGVVHVHTTASDGTGSPEEVAAAAAAEGLGFLVVTDHNTLDAKDVEGYSGETLVLVGVEASTQSGHLLGLGIPDPVFRFSGDAADALDDIRLLGGAAFAAHPLSARADFRWTGWELPGPWGMELLNTDSQWREAGAGSLLKAAALHGLNPRYALLQGLGRPTSALERWDALLAVRDVPGIAGADAHARIVLHRDWVLRLPSYRSMFGLFRNHVLLDAPLEAAPERDGPAVVAALARGRSYLGVDALAPADGFFVRGRGGGGNAGRWATRWPRGRISACARAAACPAARASRCCATVRSRGRPRRVWALDSVTSGVYRVEVRVPGWDVPWILSNPIYVFPPDAAEKRRQRGAWPDEPAGSRRGRDRRLLRLRHRLPSPPSTPAPTWPRPLSIPSAAPTARAPPASSSVWACPIPATRIPIARS